MASKVALVTGGNGISGNALVEHLIRQPEHEWSKIVVTSNSPLKAKWQDHRIRFIAVDFLLPMETIVAKLKPHCSDVTHAYYCSYIHKFDNDFDNLWQQNVPLFTNFLTAVDTVAEHTLQRVCLQTGGKHYGVHIGAMHAPISEEITPRWDDGHNFYFPQEDFMFALQAKRNWSYNIIRPQAIIGFTPGHSGMTAALKLVQYLLICRELGEAPHFPGNEIAYNAVDDFSYAPSIADLSIWATTQENTKNEAFNHANGDVICWRFFYPRIAKYLGVEIPEQLQFSSGEAFKGRALEFKMEHWAKDKKPVWDAICKRYGGVSDSFDWGAWAYFDWAGSRTWLTLMSLSKARKMGWTRYDDSYDAWVKTIRAFENSGVLPDHSLWEDRKA